MPVTVTKVEDIGRHRILRADLDGNEIAVIVPENAEIPADPRVSFDPAGVSVYADSWRVDLGGAA